MPRPLEFTQISSDAFKSWSRCKRQFFYKHVKKMQWPADIQHFRLGRDVHKLLDYQARGLDCGLLLANAPMDVRVSWQKLLNHPIAHLPVIANEWAFHTPISTEEGYTDWLTGRIDRVARRQDMVLVIDWKTGTGVPRNPELDWQTRLYLYALLEVAHTPSAEDLGLNPHGPLQPEQVQFVYVEVKADTHTPVREVVLPYNSAKHEATRQTLQAIVSAMAVEEEYALPESLQCPDKFCSYRTICGIDQ
ncbi:PD-(D/E)XK nuclease family protein [Vampirovibrio sp.]|uniref:PD-(D/E)XK nuclease family protein n=1 Tax=Vampirovibrio sp. TaxID=2717857 RepID=UPI0035938A8D